MPRLNLNDKLIRALKTDKVQEDFWDSGAPGLGLRVNASGKKTFFCRYRVGRCQRRLTLGDFPALGLSEARKKARATQNQVEDGHDPHFERKKARVAETVGDIFDVFIADRAMRIAKGTLERYKGIYRREFEKTLSDIKAKELRKAHVLPILRSLAERAPTQCERAQELLQAALNHAVALELLEFNPLQKLPRFGTTRIGERHLAPEEVKAYLQAIATLPTIEQTFFYLLIIYGARPGELAEWQWSWIGADRITIPGESQKNGRSLVLPLTPSTERALAKLRDKTGETPWLFPNTPGTATRLSFRKHKLRIEKKMTASESFTLRDIRRTTETLLRELGTLPHIVSAILNHNTSQLGKVYDKSTALGEKRQAILRYERYLDRLKSGKPDDKVVEIGRKAG